MGLSKNSGSLGAEAAGNDRVDGARERVGFDDNDGDGWRADVRSASVDIRNASPAPSQSLEVNMGGCTRTNSSF